MQKRKLILSCLHENNIFCELNIEKLTKLCYAVKKQKKEGIEMSENKEEQRCYSVVKANELIQKSRFELSLIEQKTIAYICSLIKPLEDKYQLEYIFDIREYAKVCGIHYESGKNYADIKAGLKKLSDRSMWLEIGGQEVLVRWLAKVRTNKKSGKATIEIDRDLAPYLMNLKKRFAQYELYNILGMRSAFSVRIYELLKSYQPLHKKKFLLADLKERLMVQDVKSYERFPDFRRYVLEVAVKEINELTDIVVEWETETKGRKVVAIIFRIKPKSGWDSLLCRAETQKRLDKIS